MEDLYNEKNAIIKYIDKEGYIKWIDDNKDYKYNELLALLEGYLNKNNDEDYLYLPDIYFVKEGKIIGHDNESAFVATSNEEYSIDEIKNKLFNKYVKLLNDYNREDTDE